MDRSQQEGTQQDDPQETRRAAAQAFMESLNQLGQRLQSSETEHSRFPTSTQTPPVQANPSTAISPTAQPASGHPPAPDQPPAIDPQAWEEAAADIAAFMQTRQAQEQVKPDTDSTTQQD
jgi:hypothetical protein